MAFVVASIAAGVGAVAAVGGAGYSIYSSQQSAAAQRSAASANAALGRQQVNAQAAVAKYQANLNYAVSMAQADQQDKNAEVLHSSARSTERQGFEQGNRTLEKDQQINSAALASYGSSGVTTDSGAPAVVAAYNAGQQQLERMDQAYQTSLQAMDTDWKGTMSTYQAQLTRETAKQYQYAAAMADWSQQAGIAGVAVQQQQANNAADATAMTGISSAISGIGQAASAFGTAAYYSRGALGVGTGSLVGSKMNAPKTYSTAGGVQYSSTPYFTPLGTH